MGASSMIIGVIGSCFIQPPGGGLHIDTEGNPFSKAFLSQQVAEIRRPDQRCVNVQHVMKNGELYDGDTLDRILPTAQKLPPLWWWNDHPEKPTSALQ